jgi:hypothetical protein
MEERGLDYADSTGQPVQLLASQEGLCSIAQFTWNVTRKNGLNKIPFISSNQLRVIYSAYQ